MKTYSILLSILIIFGVLPLGFASSEKVAVVVSTPADAIVAAPYAKAMGYLLVYTPTEGLSDKAKRELKENGINKVIIIGGPVAVSNNVENQLKLDLKLNTVRIWGETRIETSQKVFELFTKEKPEMAKNIVIVEGFNKISPIAVSFDAPVLYYGLNRDDGVINLLKSTKKTENIIILGSSVPTKITKTASNNAKNTIIAMGSDETILKTALSYVSKINPDAENSRVAVVYVEKSSDPILDAIENFVKGEVYGVVPIFEKDENVLKLLISKISTYASSIAILSDTPKMSEVISNIAFNIGIPTTVIELPFRGVGAATTTVAAAPSNKEPTINEFGVSVDGLKVTFNIHVSDDRGLKKIVLKFGDGTEVTKNISGTDYAIILSETYLSQGKYVATLEVYDTDNAKSSKMVDVNLLYFDIIPEYRYEYITSASTINEDIPITIINLRNENLTLTNTILGNLSVSTSGNLTINANSNKTIIYTITNNSALMEGNSYKVDIVFGLNNHPEVNRTFTHEILVPKATNITTTNNKNITLQVINTTNAGIEVHEKTNGFSLIPTVKNRSIEIVIPTTDTSDTSIIENTLVHLKNIEDVLDRAEDITKGVLTDNLIKPVVIASKDVNNVTISIENISINEETKEATINTKIEFKPPTNDSYVVVAIPVGNNSVSDVIKNGTSIPKYDATKTQRNYYILENGILVLFMKDDPLLQVKLTLKIINQPPVIDYTYEEDGLNVLINASQSYDPENESLTFKWIVPGNESVSYLEGGKTINVTYPADGIYNVTLTISDGIYELSSIFTFSVSQPVAEKSAVKILANGKVIEFAGQDANTLTITGTESIVLPTITANVNVVNKKDANKGVEIYFKDNESVESIIEAMNNINDLAYYGDTITVTYTNAEMNGKNVSLVIIKDRKEFRNAMNALLNGNAEDLIQRINVGYVETATVSSGKVTFTITANSTDKGDLVLITEGNMVPLNATNVKILAVGGFDVMRYTMDLTFNGINPATNQSTYNISLNQTPSHNVRYGLAMVDKNNYKVTINVIGTNPNDVLFNASVVGNNNEEIIIENNDLITLDASKIDDIIGTIFTPETASATYSDPITDSSVSLSLQNIDNSYVIGIAYDVTDKKIVAIEQQ